MKLIPISSELVKSNLISTPKNITAPSITTLREIFARITFEATGTFTNTDKIARTTFNNDFNLTTGDGVPYGHLDVLELENIEQIRAFSFITAEDTKTVSIWVEYFHKLD